LEVVYKMNIIHNLVIPKESLFMKLFSIILLFIFNSIHSQTFEGELSYSAKMDGYIIYKSDTLKFKDLKDKMIQKGEYFDSLNIKISDLGYVKKINNGKNETIILNFNEKKKYIITEKELTVDDLNYRNIYNRQSGADYSYNEIIELSQKDTIIKLNNTEIKANRITVKKKYSKEIYLISDDFLKLPVKRNILINEVNQIYDKEVEDLIGSNLILKYTMTTTMLGYMNIDIELTKIEEKEIPMTNLEIPKFIEDKDYKRINKDSERFKFYKIVN
jgi:hypothetical protein